MSASVLAIKNEPLLQCRPIDQNDLAQVEACLIRHFTERSPAFWRNALARANGRAQSLEFPSYGVCLTAGSEIVGVLLQIYSRRGFGEDQKILCHLSSWCVDDEYRFMAPMLSIAATRRKDVIYLNISPAPHTKKAIEALGFKRYSVGQFIFMPAASVSNFRTKVTRFEEESAAALALPERERLLLAEHQAFGCHAFVASKDGDACGFVTAKASVLRNRLSCERILYCRDLDSLARFAGAIGRHFIRRGSILCIVDAKQAIPGLAGRFVPGREPKYFKGHSAPALGDLAYSEIALFNGCDEERDTAPNPSIIRRKPSHGPSQAVAGSTNVKSLQTPAVIQRRGRVRSLESDDIPQVARIFRGVFRKTSGAGSKSLERDLAVSFLEHPHYDPATSSLVYERSTGEVGGFFGALPLRVEFMGQRRLGSVMSTWMVEDRARDARSGALLAQHHFKRQHACMIVDTANAVASTFAASTKMSILPTSSLQWVMPLSYFGYAISSLGKRIPGLPFEAVAAGAEITESWVGRLKGRGPKNSQNRALARPLDVEDFALLFLEVVKSYALRPDWTTDFLQWMLAECGRRKSMGPLRLCEVVDPAGRPIGTYAFHITPTRRAVVVQILAVHREEMLVLNALIDDARRQRCVAVCGAASPRFMECLFQIPNVFYRHTCTTAARTDSPEMMQSILDGDALIGGLVGDSWLPLTTESYA